MNLLDLDPAAWLTAGLVAALNIAGFLVGVLAVVLWGLLGATLIDNARRAYRRRRTSRRAWREHG